MKQTVHNFKLALMLVAAGLISLISNAQSGSGGGSGSGSSGSGTPAPELVFKNPVLKSGTANKEGAVYRFANVTSGVDAEIKLRKFSRSDIYMRTIDNNTLGWDKAFQPEFGLQGVVPANQNWYIDFEMTFYKAGTTQKEKIQKADFTALDVDGDGWSVAEYAVFDKPKSVVYSSVSYLSNTPAGTIGQSIKCGQCNVSSPLVTCSNCKGTGLNSGNDCGNCDGSGALHDQCDHPFQGMIGNVLQGPTQNFNNIDTAATQVMATYQYENTDRIRFRYGAKSGNYSSNGSGVRLNSMWAKSFTMTPWTALPVNFSNFAVLYDKGDAIVSWKAVHGEELSHFIVQRSTDGKEFTDIATVLSGNTSAYSFKDKNVSTNTGMVYYRVVSVDFINEKQFTTIKMLRLNKGDMSTLTLATYPNPAVNDVRITLPENWQGKPVMLQLYTANGMVAKSIQLGSAGQTETMTLNGLTKGMYVVKAICGEESAQQRIVKN